MITNLYAKYLLADRLNKVAEKAGVTVHYIRVYDAPSTEVFLQVGHPEGWGNESNERAAIALLDAMSELQLERNDGLIYLTGVSNGLKFKFYTGEGSCQLVQVGTRTLPAEPAKPEREEPIYEKRCIDELAAVAP